MCRGISVERAKSDTRFDDSEVKFGHQRNILTISGHSNVISTHFRQETVERLQTLGEWMGVLKMTR